MKVIFIILTLLVSTYSSAFTNCISTECEQQLVKIIKVAEHGYIQSRVVSAIAMLDTRGKHYNPQQALDYLKWAKKLENGASTWILSNLYREGSIVEKNLKKADYLENLASKRGFSNELGHALLSNKNYDNLVTQIGISRKHRSNLLARMRSNSNPQALISRIDRK